MSEQPENLILVYLHRIDEKLDRVIADVQDLKHRVTALEMSAGHLHSNYGGLQFRLARMDIRLDRIERRLGLQEIAG